MRIRTWTQTLLLVIAPALCVVVSSGDVLAQPKSAGAKPGAKAQTDAKAPGAQPSEQDIAKAQLHFKKGSDFFTMKKYSLALEEFKKSYGFVASPNSHLYIGRCMVHLGNHREAYLELDQVVDEAAERAKSEEKYAPTRDTAALERDEVGSKLALITVNVTGATPESKLFVGGTEVPRERWGKPYPVTPGSTEVVVRTGSQPEVKEELKLAAGNKKEVALNAAPVASSPTDNSALAEGADTGSTTPDAGANSSGDGAGKLRPYAYVAGGVGVAGLAVFGIFGAMANATYSDLEETCKGPCSQDRADDVNTGKTQQTVANIGLIVGVVGVAAAVPLFILSSGSKSTEKASSSTTHVVVGPGFTGVRGSF